MYIRRFGGSWLEHPFWKPRFVVRDEDLDRIRQSTVPFVEVDDERGVAPEPIGSRNRGPASRAALPGANVRVRRVQERPAEEPFEQSRRSSERQRATALMGRSLKVMRQTFSDVRLGRAVRMENVVTVVDEVVNMVERSPRTLLEVLRLKKKDEYTYLHSVAVCTLMINMARQLGKDEAVTRDYGMAGLLHDIGKMGIADDILNKPDRLTDAEFDQVRNHPEHGYQVLLQTPNVPPMALDVCRHHHERVDGKGYPCRLSGDALTIEARLGAICDVYDALTSDRVYKGAWSPVEAMSAMWRWEGQFDRPLLFAFMQSIGVFPPGMLVRLRSNRLGLVLDYKRVNSRPRVLAFYSTRDRELVEPEEIVISDSLANDSIVGVAHPGEWGLGDAETLKHRILSGTLEISRAA